VAEERQLRVFGDELAEVELCNIEMALLFGVL
jgi:hypothetical protein